MNTYNDEQIENFCTWLKALPEPEITDTTTRLVPQALLDQAWETAKSHREYLFDHGLYHETLPLPCAASDGADVPFQLQSIGGEWSVTREFILGNETQQMLKWRCHKEYLDTYEQRRIVAQIGEQTFDLGDVFNGVAQKLIPRNVDLAKDKVTISIEKIVEQD